MLRSVLSGGAVGLALGLVALAPGFVAGTGGLWERPQNDIAQYLIAWSYYLADGWRWPLFDVPALGYPEGGSVTFMDALPLGALLTKGLHGAIGVRVNPFGWWIALAYVLQGAMAARLAWAAGARSAWAGVAAAALAVCSAAFLGRLAWEHLAVSSHFVLLWALALHFEDAQRGRPRLAEWFALGALTLLVNAYLFAMVMALAGATALALWTKSRPPLRELAGAALAGVGLVGIAIAAGYGVMFTNPARMQGTGFGLFSWNLAGLLVPPELGSIARDATSGQYEGEAYVGHGALLLLALGVAASPRRAARAVRRHAWLCAVLGLLALYAASNRVYFSETLLVSYELPAALAELCSYFRASGRFVWPLAYALAVLPVALVFRAWPRALALAALLAAALLQVADVRHTLAGLRAMTSAPHADLLEPGLADVVGRHARVWLYPSWGCGSIGGPERPWHGDAANWDLQLQLAASRTGVPINSVYTSRLLKDCRMEAEWGRRPTLEEGVLYVLGHAAVREPELAAFVRAGPCRRLRFAVVCSADAAVP